MKKTKIVCTIGPACDNEETLTKMALAGMDVARLNFSHGTHEEHKKKVESIKAVRERLNIPLSIMLDTKGPEYRIKCFKDGKITLKEGDKFNFTINEELGDQTHVSVSYKGMVDELNVGDTILLNNGLMSFEVVNLIKQTAECIVLTGGELSDRKSMSFPNKHFKQIYLSEQDKRFIVWHSK